MQIFNLVYTMFPFCTHRPLLPESEQQQLMCEHHEEEKINICLTCEVPTCSMCKVFGVHKKCDVAPLPVIYKKQKAELNDAIGILVAGNDRMQSLISQMEDICRSIETLLGHEQDQKLTRVRFLIRRNGDHLETSVKLVETAIQSMEEPNMAVFLENTKVLLERITDTAKGSSIEWTEPGVESMAHIILNTEEVASMLRDLVFQTGEVEEERGDEDPMASSVQHKGTHL
ncbi:hypothetical protein DNTS_008942 [Danionella cerebrum]|uniref:RING-type E3 ubiquitin transferase n=1 Tax=Danionella cerebrum TaxID=2873325 RepID=A0A553RL84_9TELE|nr:hypothetical protein DNTS_008942 [Danionella translucida]